MKFFKPEDFFFIDDVVGDKARSEICDIANAKLKSEGIKVYCHRRDQLFLQCDEQPSTDDTHTALVINIEAIPQTTQHEHEPKLFKQHGFHAAGCEVTKEFWACLHCGKQLKWEILE